MARALLIIDVQNDFARPHGALPVPRGEEVIEPINALARSGRFDLVVATRDWHPDDHASFAEHGGPWPPHCVRGTAGAELVAELDREAIDAIVDKGTERTGEGYSGFEADELIEHLRRAGVDEVTIVGLAADYCVRHTALDARRHGLRVRLHREGVRGIAPETTAAALAELEDAGVEIA